MNKFHFIASDVVAPSDALDVKYDVWRDNCLEPESMRVGELVDVVTRLRARLHNVITWSKTSSFDIETVKPLQELIETMGADPEQCSAGRLNNMVRELRELINVAIVSLQNSGVTDCDEFRAKENNGWIFYQKRNDANPVETGTRPPFEQLVFVFDEFYNGVTIGYLEGDSQHSLWNVMTNGGRRFSEWSTDCSVTRWKPIDWPDGIKQKRRTR